MARVKTEIKWYYRQEIKWIFNTNSSKSHLLLFCFFSSTPLQYCSAGRYQVCSYHLRQERSLRPFGRRGAFVFPAREQETQVNIGRSQLAQEGAHALVSTLVIWPWRGCSLRFCLPLLASNARMHTGETLPLAISVNTFLTCLHNLAALSMGVNPWKLPAFMCIKATPKHISKQIASAHGCLLRIDFMPTTLWMHILLKCKVAWHFSTYTSTKMKAWKWMLSKK